MRSARVPDRVDARTAPSPGSTASPASPATWRSARWSTPAPTSTRCARCASGCPSGGWELEAEAVHARRHRRHQGPRARRASRRVVRTAAHITALVDEARLPDRVRRRALATFDALAGAEGRLHRRPPEQVHFHEVGGIDAIVDVVGTCAALELLGVDEVDVEPGGQRHRHGPQPPTACCPIPAPAVVELLRGRAHLRARHPARADHADRRRAAGRAGRRLGADAGHDDRRASASAPARPMLERPAQPHAGRGRRRGPPTLDRRPAGDAARGQRRRRHRRALAHAVATLLDAGAHDAWITPIVMKKGRPAHIGERAGRPGARRPGGRACSRARPVRSGVRGQTLERWPQARLDDARRRRRAAVRVKVGAGRVKVEHDDAARVARQTGKSVRDVISLAEERWRHEHRGEPVEPRRRARRRSRLISLRRSTRCERARTERTVARVLDRLGAPSRPLELALQTGQVLERHAHVDVVGEVPAGVERHDPEAGPRQIWRTTWVVWRRSFDRAMPPCSAIERSRLMTRHTVIHGASQNRG